MELKNLVKYKQLILSLDDTSLRKNINTQLSDMLVDLDVHEVDYDNLKQTITDRHLEILKNLEDISTDLNKFRQHLKDEVKKLEEPY